MVSLDNAIIIRYKKLGETYEIYVDADKALDYKSGQDIPIADILASDHIFKDAAAGDKASEIHLQDIFKTKDLNEVLIEILKKGELHLTTEQKRKMREERRKQVATIIARNAINPQTNTPHPLARIESAMDEAKVDINISKSANEQVEKAVKALKPIIPIRFEKLDIVIQVPAEYGGKLYHILNEFGQIKKDEWKGAEQFIQIEIPAGLQDQLYTKINGLTHGNVKTQVIKHD